MFWNGLRRKAINMTKEQIEKVVATYTAQAEDSDYAEVRDVKQAFVSGAKWRINSVWHNMEEKPNFKIIPILLKHKSGTIHFIDETPAHLEYMMKYYVRWAYIEDLLPNTEE